MERKELNKRIKKREKGITLIALVITIIVLLILAGVSISMLTDENGILNRATDASKKTQFASEKEAIEFVINDMKIGSYISDESKVTIGEKLLDKKIGNSDWKVVLNGDNVYGTNWYLVKKETEISGFGKLEKNWLINYNTGEIIVLDDEDYSIISATDSIAIKDNIIFNLDSSVIDRNIKNTEEDLENSLGNGVKLNGFDFNENSGLTDTSFKFDGNNDYIEMPFSKDIYNFDGGLTLEFYGKIFGKGKIFDEITGEEIVANNVIMLPFLEIRNSSTNKGKVGLAFDGDDDVGHSIKAVNFNLGTTFKRAYSKPYIGSLDGWNRLSFFKDYGLTINYSEDVFFTVCVDGNNNKIYLYVDGSLVETRLWDESEDVWNNFITNSLERLRYNDYRKNEMGSKTKRRRRI